MFKSAVFAFLFGCAFWCSTLSAQTTVQFSADPSDLPGAFAAGPFPTDILTVVDLTKSTGLRVNLPSSENTCSESSPVCSNNAALNQLDGFSVNPRLMVCFSGPVNPATLPTGMEIVSLPGRSAVPVTQVVFDTNTNCAFAKPANVLNQASQYLLLVSSAVQDSAGKPVVASPAFNTCHAGVPVGYCTLLAASLLGQSAPGGGTIVAASLFTTMNATGWLEAARRYVDSQSPSLAAAGATSTFKLSQLSQITWVPANSGLAPQSIPLSALSNVDSVSFGIYMSPNYLNAATISAGPTAPTGLNTVSYHVFLPKSPASQKIPVVIYGHGLGDSQFGAPTYIASTLAARGFATLAIEFPGHGYGAGSYVTLTGTNNKTSTVMTPGRGVGGATIGSTDGCIASGGSAAIGVRDCGRQAALDLETIVHDIVATNGLGLNLDPSHIYYVGQSFGSTVGTLFAAVDPTIPAAVLNGDGGTSTDIARLAITGRPLGYAFLASVVPAPFNVPPAPPEEPYDALGVGFAFNDCYLFKNQPPATEGPTGPVPGALTIQAAFEAPDWLGMLGDPLAFAPHLQTAPLTGVPAKKVLFQFGFGDLEVPNPVESSVVQAAGAQSSTSFLNFQVAAQLDPSLVPLNDPAVGTLPILPHRVLANPTIFTSDPGELSLALAEQQQVADFFASNGSSITDPNKYLITPFSPGQGIFSTPASGLPQTLNFFQFGQ